MNLTLSALSRELESTLDAVDPETGELPEGYEEIRDLVAAKAHAVAAYMLNASAVADLIDERAKELAGQAKTIRKRQDWLNRYLIENMARCDMTEIAASDGSFRIKRYPQRDKSVEVFDIGSLPDGLTIEKTEWVADKKAIRSLLDEGVDVPGARLVVKDRLEIK